MSGGPRFRVGVAGLGFGAAVHVPGLRGIPGVEVVALAGTRQERAAEAASGLGIPHACGSVEEMLDLDPPLDAVSLALPPDESERVLPRVLARRLHVLAEKPVGISAVAASACAAEAAGLTTAVDFEIAETATFRTLHDLVAGGELGAPRRVSVVWRMESSGRRQGRWSWKLDARRGGGVVSLLGSHLLYLAEWAFGPLREVSAALRRDNTAAIAPAGELPAEDRADVELRRDGFVFSFHLDNAWSGTPGHEWTIEFERGHARVANAGPDAISGFALTVVPDVGPDRLVARETPAAEGDARIPPFRALATRFVEAARRGEPCWPDLTSGARVQLLMEAITASAAGGIPVRV